MSGEKRQPTEELLRSEGVMISYSHCLYCGRRTPHEICHGCAQILTAGETPSMDWEHAGDEPETCEFADEDCPILQAEERALRQREEQP